MTDISNGHRFNANSWIIMMATAIMLGVMGWVGRTGADNNDKLARMETSLPYLQTSVVELKNTVSGLITRPELDSKIAEIKADQAKIQLDILKMSYHKGVPNE